MNVVEALSVLGLEIDADEDAIRSRYRELVKQSPPERDPERFARVRAAFELASDPRARAAERVLGPHAYHDLGELAADLRRQQRRPLGASAWLEVMRR